MWRRLIISGSDRQPPVDAPGCRGAESRPALLEGELALVENALKKKVGVPKPISFAWPGIRTASRACRCWKNAAISSRAGACSRRCPMGGSKWPALCARSSPPPADSHDGRCLPRLDAGALQDAGTHGQAGPAGDPPIPRRAGHRPSLGAYAAGALHRIHGLSEGGEFQRDRPARFATGCRCEPRGQGHARGALSPCRRTVPWACRRR